MQVNTKKTEQHTSQGISQNQVVNEYMNMNPFDNSHIINTTGDLDSTLTRKLQKAYGQVKYSNDSGQNRKPLKLGMTRIPAVKYETDERRVLNDFRLEEGLGSSIHRNLEGSQNEHSGTVNSSAVIAATRRRSGQEVTLYNNKYDTQILGS